MYEILSKEALNPTVVRIRVHAPRIARKAEPGQFIILRAKEQSERIPLTVADFDRDEGSVTVIYQIVGAGTMELNTLNAGDCLHDLVGPLGTPTHTDGLKKVCIVGGETKFACVDGPDFDGHLVDFDEAMARGAMYRDFEQHAREEACRLFQKEAESNA